jgi:Bacterial extracellular solute-binding proteins, family 5 Middle
MHTHRQGGSRIRVAVMLVLGALLAGGLTEPAEAKDQWVVAVPEEAESLDPQASALFTSEVYQQHIFDPLVGIEGEDLKPVGLLAERWETVSPTTWLFQLRKGVKFHSGELLDAEDVNYTMGLYTDPKGVRAVYGRPIQRVEVRDAHTVDIVTHEPFAALLTNLARLVVLPKETREKVGAAPHPADGGLRCGSTSASGWDGTFGRMRQLITPMCRGVRLLSASPRVAERRRREARHRLRRQSPSRRSRHARSLTALSPWRMIHLGTRSRKLPPLKGAGGPWVTMDGTRRMSSSYPVGSAPRNPLWIVNPEPC